MTILNNLAHLNKLDMQNKTWTNRFFDNCKKKVELRKEESYSRGKATYTVKPQLRQMILRIK